MEGSEDVPVCDQDEDYDYDHICIYDYICIYDVVVIIVTTCLLMTRVRMAMIVKVMPASDMGYKKLANKKILKIMTNCLLVMMV